jgi:DNA polymerase-3 subunit gamma/tau
MALLRMLAFAPATTDARPAAPRAAPLIAQTGPRTSTPASRSQQPPDVASASAAPSKFDGNWPALVARLTIGGLVKELASRSELVSHEGDHFKLRVPLKTLLDAGTLDKLKAAVSHALGRPIRLTAEVGAPAGPTAAGIAEHARAEKQRRAEEAIYADPFVRELIDNFGATVDPASIRPKDA